MKINLSVLIGCVVCIVLAVGVGVLNRAEESGDAWRPSSVYSHVGSSSSSVVSSGSSASSGVAVPMRGGRSMISSSRRVSSPVSSYAPAHYAPSSPANGQYPIGGTSSYGQSPIANRQGLYTTSSATAKSFGSGNAVSGVSMSGGSVRATNNQSLVSNIQSPITNIQSPIANVQLPTMPKYQGIGNTTTNGPRAMRGRQNAAPSNNGYNSWLRWLDEYGSDYADGYDDETGTYTYSEQSAWNAYVAWYNSVYGCNPGEYGGSNPEVTWEMWLSWFKSNNGSHQGNDGWHNFVPVGDYLPLLFMALLYVAYIFIRRREVKKTVN